MGPEAHEDRLKRYTRSGVLHCYLYSDRAVWRFGHRAADFFSKELVVAIAGIALLSTIGDGLASALRDERHREPALITFLGHAQRNHVDGRWLCLLGRGRHSLALFVQQYKTITFRPASLMTPASSWMLRGCMRPFSGKAPRTIFVQFRSLTVHTPCKFCSLPILLRISRSTRHHLRHDARGCSAVTCRCVSPGM